MSTAAGWLGRGDLRWTLGTGYINLWQQLHRAEEALILAAPVERLVAGAFYDELRLQGSNIENRDKLAAQLKQAVTVLAARAKFQPANPQPAAGGPVPAVSTLTYGPQDEVLARELLRQVRRALNEYRDDRWSGLVRARNQLLKTVFLTGIVTFALLSLVIIAGGPSYVVLAGAVFYVVGATVGLFNRLYLDSIAETAVEDYGLSTARLLHTPLLSGLAALGAVVVIPMLSALANAAKDQPDVIVPLVDIFDLGKRPFGLVLAAIFGLSPTLLISRLQQEAERYKADLKSSEAPAGK